MSAASISADSYFIVTILPEASIAFLNAGLSSVLKINSIVSSMYYQGFKKVTSGNQVRLAFELINQKEGKKGTEVNFLEIDN